MKRKIVTKPLEKRNVSHSQLQALSQLDAVVNKLAEVNAKRMKLEQEDTEALLKFRRDEATKYRDHEKEMVQLYLHIIMQQAIPHNVFHSQYSAPHTSERFNLTNSFTAQPSRYCLPTSLPSPPNNPPVQRRFPDAESYSESFGSPIG